ncbi:MAG TPA: hypothetical protein ENN19_03795 [Chloroflexi bacterium]|nr:hypothetical protein [Chloroflexota bacterium]
MRSLSILITGLFLATSSLACCIVPNIPDINIDINIPTIEVGEMQTKREEIPLSGAEFATVNILFGAGELEIEAGEADTLLAARFRYNVEQWEPIVAYDDGVLTVEQGGVKGNWGIPTGNTRNDWNLKFSPAALLEIDLDLGAGKGDLDFTGLQITALDVDAGAGNFNIHFDEPVKTKMENLALNAGASKIEITGIGNVSPEQVKVQGGVGDITLDFTGDWARSADVQITAGVGSLTLRLPDDVGIEVKTEGGLTNVDVEGLRREGNAYVNDAFGDTEIEVRIAITTGIGNLRLIEVAND